MSFEEELVDMLQADASVVATVGDRIWPVAIRLNPVFPAITYGRESGGREYALDANVTAAHTVLTVRCWATDYPAARELATAVTAALDRVTTTDVQVMSVRDGADMYLDTLNVFGCTLMVEMEQWL